jgi:predicted AlkP superfamily pyrophosphatase or phosphodiesterase
MKKQDKNIRSAAFYLWDWLQYLMNSGTAGCLDHEVYCDPTQPLAVHCDNSTATDASEYIKEVFHSVERSYTFIYLMGVDEAGHRYTWCSDEYMAQMRVIDGFIGQILDVIDDENMQDDVMVVLTSDHGGHGLTHGTYQDDDLIVPMFFRGPGIKKNYAMRGDVRNIDVAATIARAMGYRTSVWWKGTAVNQIFVNTLP